MGTSLSDLLPQTPKTLKELLEEPEVSLGGEAARQNLLPQDPVDRINQTAAVDGEKTDFQLNKDIDQRTGDNIKSNADAKAVADQLKIELRQGRRNEVIEADGLVERAGEQFWKRIRGLGAGGGRVINVMLEEAGVSADSDVSRWLRERAMAGEDYAARRVQDEQTWEALKEKPSVGALARFVIEQGASSIADMGVLASGAGIVPWIGAQTGDIGQQRAENNDGLAAEADANDALAALPAATASALLERLGIHGIFGGAGKTVLGRMTQAFGAEALTEALQSPIEYAGSNLFTKEGFDWAEAGDQALAGAVAGGFMGGAIRGGVEAGIAGNNVVEKRRASIAESTAINQEAVQAFEPTQPAAQQSFLQEAIPDPRQDVELSAEDRASPLPDKFIQKGKNSVADALGDVRPVKRAPPPKVAAPFDKLVQVTLGSESGNRDFNNAGGVLTSPAGARGKMQVMPGTQTDPGFGVKAAQNNSMAELARVGRDYLAAMLRRYNGDPAKMWAAYNWGPGALDSAIEKHGNNWLDHSPDETRKYVMKNLSKIGAVAFDPTSGDLAAIDAPVQLEIDSETAEDFTRRVLGDDFMDVTAASTEVDPALRASLDSVQSIEGTVPTAGVDTTSLLENQTSVEPATLSPQETAPLQEQGGPTASGDPFPTQNIEVAPIEASAPVAVDPAPAITSNEGKSENFKIEPTSSGKGITVYGLKPGQVEAIERALPAKVTAITKSDGGLTYSKKHEAKIRDTLTNFDPISLDDPALTAGERAAVDFAASKKGELYLRDAEDRKALSEIADSGQSVDARQNAVLIKALDAKDAFDKWEADGKKISQEELGFAAKEALKSEAPVTIAGQTFGKGNSLTVDQSKSGASIDYEVNGFAGGNLATGATIADAVKTAVPKLRSIIADKGAQTAANRKSAQKMLDYLGDKFPADNAGKITIAAGQEAKIEAAKKSLNTGKQNKELEDDYFDRGEQAFLDGEQRLPPKQAGAREGSAWMDGFDKAQRVTKAASTDNRAPNPDDRAAAFKRGEKAYEDGERRSGASAINQSPGIRSEFFKGWDAAYRFNELKTDNAEGRLDDEGTIELIETTAKKKAEPLVSVGQKFTINAKVGYLGPKEGQPPGIYTVESVGKRGVYFRNDSDGGKSDIPNWQLKKALADGVIVPAEEVSVVSKKPDNYGATNRIVTKDRAAELREKIQKRLKSAQLNSGFDPELMAAGLELSAFHIEAGARKFGQYAKAISSDLDMSMKELKPYLRAWYNGARDFLEDSGQDVADMDGPGAVRAGLNFIEDTETQAGANGEIGGSVADNATGLQDNGDIRSKIEVAFVRAFDRGMRFRSITDARAFARQETGQDFKAGSPEAKILEEAIELATVRVARSIALQGPDLGYDRAYGRLVALYNAQPKLGTRTSTSVAQQAFSTPAPLAYLASRLAGINSETKVYEPTAGNGMLLVDTAAQNATVNELNPDRAEQLRRLLPDAKITEKDATTFDPNVLFDAVIANPPFGVVKDEDGASTRFEVDLQYSTNEVDHAIAMKALESLKDDGKAVLLVGGISQQIVDPEKRANAYNGKSKREFYFKLYKGYNVTDHFTVDGSLYERQGAGWPVDVIVIDGRGKSNLTLPAVKAPPQFNDWTALAEKLNDRSTKEVKPAGNTDGSPVEQVERPARVDAANNAADGTNRIAGSQRADQNGVSNAIPDGRADGQPESNRLDGSSDGNARLPDNQQRGSVDRSSKPVINETAENERQATYQAGSSAKTMGTLVPVNMAESLADALDLLEQRVGNIDAFVSDRLGYKKSDLSNYFGAEQVDAIALAVDNIERGAGFIIGDQTGIGKGRVNAAMIRYAIIQKRNPIFVTEKPNLYGDMFRDLQDIGVVEMLGRDMNIVMTDAGKTVLLDEETGSKLKTPAAKAHNAYLESLRGKKLSEEGIDAIFTTYSQMQTLKGGETSRRKVLKSLANGGVLMLDESHNAGGQSGQQTAKGEAPNRAEFVRNLVTSAHGVFYSSATYAKRPDVMDLYSATDMKLAVPDLKNLGEAISKGGVPMQQVVASMLARSGQYVRRERSFDGISYNTPTVPIDRELYSKASQILKQIQDFSELSIAPVVKDIDLEIREDAKTISKDNATGSVGAASTNFTSIMHNIIDQMLLAFTSDAAAKRAIDAIKNDEKPVITVANTLEAFLDQYSEDEGISIGEEIDITFADVFARYLERSRWITVKKPFAEKGTKGERIRLTDDQIGPAAVEAFKQGMQFIRSSGLDSLPGSPLDYILSQIEAAGYVVGEITGRSLGLNYRNGKAYLKARKTAERSIAGRQKTISGYNNGKIDAILINRSGSTGLSLHASEKFKDQRKRRMIIGQAEGNIDTHMQLLGRVHRTGQVVLPEYDQLVGDVPAQKRPAAVLAKKMASLNANTTASRDSALTSSETLDFMNEYGDEVVARIMEEEPDIHDALSEPLKEEDEGYVRDGAARKVTGRIPLLPVDQQDELYQRIEDEYRALLAQKEAAGENALEAKTFSLDAKTIATAEAIPAVAGSTSPFAGAVMVETVDVKRLGKPFSSDEVTDQVRAGIVDLGINSGDLQGKSIKELLEHTRAGQMDLMRAQYLEGQDFMRAQIDNAATSDTASRTRDRLQTNMQRFLEIRRTILVGESIKIRTAAGNFYGVVTDIQRTGNAKNPLALGSWKLTTSVVDSARTMTFPLSQVETTNDSDLFSKVVIEKEANIGDIAVTDAFDSMQSESRENRMIVTGNLLAGFDYVNGNGAIINYTTDNGTVKQGIMMRRDFNLEKHIEAKGIPLTNSAAIVEWLQSEGGTITGQGSTGSVSLFAVRDSFAVTSARTKSAGGEFFLNQRLIKALGVDFVSKSTGMVAEASLDKAEGAVRALLESGVRFEVAAQADKEVKERARAIAEKYGSRFSVSNPVSELTQFAATPATPPVNSNWKAVQEKLRDQVKKLGLADKVTLEVTDKILNNPNIQGAIEGRIIRIALQSNSTRSKEFVVDHEVIHALQRLGSFKRSEWSALEKTAREDAPLMADIKRRYPELNERQQLEEAIADMFAKWREGQRRPNGFIRDAFKRVINIFAALRNAIRKSGNVEAVESILENIASGEIGSRERSGNMIFQPEGAQFSLADSALNLVGGKEAVNDRIDIWRTNLQNRMLPLLRRQQRSEIETGQVMPESMNPYLKEELMSGKVGARLETLSDELVQTLFDGMEAEGITGEELETYLYARHAPERNARISEMNADFDEGTGSGMTDSEAAAIMTQADLEGKLPALERTAGKVDKILKFAVDTRVEAGLLSEEEATAWRENYQFYVPLRGREELEPEKGAGGINRGSGITVRGKESKRAFGRKSKAVDILAYSIMQAEESVMRAGKNEVAQAFYNLAKSSPDKSFWSINKVTRTPFFNEKTGTVSYRNQTQIQPEDEQFTVVAKFDGQEFRVTMNRDNPKAVQLAEAMRNLNGTDLGTVMQMLARVNRFLSFVNTGLNPEFVITNAFRDLQTAGINLAGFDEKGLIKGTMKDYLPALNGSIRGAFKKDKGEWGKWYNEFVNEGGRVYFNRLDDLNDIQRRIEKKLKSQSGGIGAVQSGITDVFDFIQNANTGVENAVRLSAYKNAREAGMTKAQAASLAKNLTVNFNRRGAWGVGMNSLYLFYNASVQGSARLFLAMKHKRVQKMLAGAVAVGFALDALNMMLSGDDEDGESYYNKISSFDKSRNLIVMIPDTKGKHIKIPLPYGYNAFFGIGRTASEINSGKRWQDSMASLLTTIVDSFNPIGGSDNLGNFLSPTIGDPVVDLIRNRDFADRPIMPEQNQFGPEKPDNQRYWGSVSPHWRIMSKILNEGTGGDDVVPGAVDVSPETLEHISGYVTGAAGTFWIDRIGGLGEKVVGGEEITANDIPMFRKVIGEKPGWYDKAAYYARTEEIEQFQHRAKQYRERGEDEAAEIFEDRSPDIADMASEAKRAQKTLRGIRKERALNQKAFELGDIDEPEYNGVRDNLKIDENLVIEDFNALYLETVEKPKRP